MVFFVWRCRATLLLRKDRDGRLREAGLVGLNGRFDPYFGKTEGSFVNKRRFSVYSSSMVYIMCVPGEIRVIPPPIFNKSRELPGISGVLTLIFIAGAFAPLFLRLRCGKGGLQTRNRRLNGIFSNKGAPANKFRIAIIRREYRVRGR